MAGSGGERENLSERLARGDQALFAEVVELLAEAVTVRSVEGQIVYANRAALAHLGLESRDELHRRSAQSIMDEYLVEDEHGRPLTMDDVPSVRLMAGRGGGHVLMRTVHRVTGELRWDLLKTTPLRDADGTLIGAMTVIEDVTAVKAAEVQTRVLAESGRILASSLDYQRTLRNVTEIAVPSLADYCSVDLIGPDNRTERVAATHRDPTRGQIAAELRQLGPDTPQPDSPTHRVLASGTSELFDEVTDEQLEAVSRDEGHLTLLRQLGLRSVMVVPMRVPAHTIGIMTLATDQSRRRLGHADVELAEQLARRAAVAVENARLHTELAGVASTLQQSLRPDAPPEIPGWDIAALYRPAAIEQRIDVGGDFYEFFQCDGHWFAIFGDVTGKGVQAASLTTMMRYGARVACRADPTPSAILASLDEVLAAQAGDALCTALCLRIHPAHVVISSAGHPPGLVVAPSGEVREASATGPLLGAFQDSAWREEAVAVAPGELLVLYTDGVTETPGTDGRFGDERLVALLSEQAGNSPAEVLRRLDSELEDFSGARGRDDVAVLALAPKAVRRQAEPG
ncbi:MAG TPA: SpoIIE family protein phosphatase [Solirubrobacteraceae bacterium]|nr:SpoIIE family protein phosphatase [Solirubrobacteraceae bacterium]